MRVKIKVTAKDIKKGERHSALYCPVAIAATRALGVHVMVDETNICVRENGKWRPHRTPRPVCRFVNRFDMGLPVEPMEFTVNLS